MTTVDGALQLSGDVVIPMLRRGLLAGVGNQTRRLIGGQLAVGGDSNMTVIGGGDASFVSDVSGSISTTIRGSQITTAEFAKCGVSLVIPVVLSGFSDQPRRGHSCWSERWRERVDWRWFDGDACLVEWFESVDENMSGALGESFRPRDAVCFGFFDVPV
jgi:hypothetical protein